MDIESFWTEDYAGQIPNSGHELAIKQKSGYFMIFSVSSISYYRPTDLKLSSRSATKFCGLLRIYELYKCKFIKILSPVCTGVRHVE